MTANRREFLRSIAIALASSGAGLRAETGLFRFPYVQDVRRTRATVRWTTRTAGSGAIEYWNDSAVNVTAVAQLKAYLPEETGYPAPYYRYEAVLNRLEPGTAYQYRVLMDGQPVTTEALTFRTPGSKPFEFLAFGDSGTGSDAQSSVARQMVQHKPDFILHTGDLVYPAGTFERYESLYFALYKDLMREAPFFPCPGNHDYYETNCIPYRAIHSLPTENVAGSEYGRYYSFDWGNAHFISLDSNDALRDAAEGKGGMLRWLEQDLERTNKFWRIVFLHHPAYCSDLHHGDESEPWRIRNYIAPILDRFAVPLVFNGHAHSYQRSIPITGGKASAQGEGTVYVTTGGGGAELHAVGQSPLIQIAVAEHHFVSASVNAARLTLYALRPDGTEIDAAAIAPRPVLREGGVVDGASFSRRPACGGLASVFGFQLAPEEAVAGRYPLPFALGGAQVLLNDRPLPLLMVSGGQINVQLPFDFTGASTLTVRTPNGTASCPVRIEESAPALFAGAVFHSDGAAVSEDSPARAGEILSAYLTGLGAPAGPAVAGEAAKRVPSAAAVRVKLGEVTIEPQYAGLAEGLSGVNLVTFQVPAGLPNPAALRIATNDAESNAVTLPVTA